MDAPIGCATVWDGDGVPWSIFFSNASNLAAIPVIKFRSSKKSLVLASLFCLLYLWFVLRVLLLGRSPLSGRSFVLFLVDRGWNFKQSFLEHEPFSSAALQISGWKNVQFLPSLQPLLPVKPDARYWLQTLGWVEGQEFPLIFFFPVSTDSVWTTPV